MNNIHLNILGSSSFSNILNELEFTNILRQNNSNKKKVLVKILFAENLKINAALSSHENLATLYYFFLYNLYYLKK